jgi:N-methylhydantoinase B/oxoprolinase/acetone carboxylase alpha subunit
MSAIMRKEVHHDEEEISALQFRVQKSCLEAGRPFELHKGDVLVIELPGGGGFGPAEKRDPILQEADRRDGLL